MRLEGKRILLTGASRGVGNALAHLLVERGATVLAVARNQEALNALAADLGRNLLPLECDLANRHSRNELVDRIRSDLGPIHGLVNNAGIQISADYTKATQHIVEGDIAREVEINLTAPMHLCAALLPLLGGREAGLILNVTSGLALTPKRDAPVYCATKAGLRSFTTALRYQAEASGSQVKVAEVVFPLIDTDMTSGRGRGKITPQQAAAAVVDGLTSGQPVIRVGKIRLLHALHRLSPGLAARILRG